MVNWLSGAGELLTYRDFWATSLAVYTACIGLFSFISYIALSMYGNRYWFMEPSKRNWRDDLPIYAVCGMYIVSQILMLAQALANAILVFGGSPFWSFIGIQLLVHVFFVCVKMMLGPTPWTLSSFALISGTAILGSIQTLSMFDYVSPRITWLIGFAASSPLAILLSLRFFDHDESIRYGGGSLKSRVVLACSRKFFLLLILSVYLLGMFITYFSAGTCLLVYGNKASGSWISLSPSAQWSSRWMRTASINPCPADGLKPCHVYLTAGTNLTSEVFVNVHLPLNTPGSTLVVYFNRAEVVAEEYTVPMLDEHLQRRFFVAHLTGLGPENSFFLRIGFKTVGEEQYWFRMVPIDSPVSMVIAGDSGITDTADKIMDQMIATRPHVAFIGGDVAYDNGLLSCSCVWDDFLTMWETKRVNGKYLVPLSFAVGNHDVGVTDNYSAFDTLSESKCDPNSPRHARPMFFDWFPHEVDSNGHVLPSCKRTTMRKHSIGNKVNVWMLDTAYTVSAADNVKFVDSNMGTKRPDTNIAIYHVPMYAANLDDLSDGPYLREVWPSKIFDKYGFKACFENHAHAYKRTKRLVNNTVVDKGGTVYIGDGRMGITDALERDRMIAPNGENLFAHTDVEYHFLSVSVAPTGKVVVNAVNEKGVVFDSQEL